MLDKEEQLRLSVARRDLELEKAADIILILDELDKRREYSKKVREAFKDLNNRDYSHLEESNWWYVST